MTTEVQLDLHRAWFTDANEEQVFSGLRLAEPELWNGWECPYFDRRESMMVIEFANLPGSGMRMWMDDDDVIHCDYGTDADHVSQFAPVHTQYGPLWAIGAGEWCWSLAVKQPPRDSVELDSVNWEYTILVLYVQDDGTLCTDDGESDLGVFAKWVRADGLEAARRKTEAEAFWYDESNRYVVRVYDQHGNPVVNNGEEG